MASIKDQLISSNPWWKQKYILEYKEREIYHKIKKYMLLPQIIALTGIRRIGKTTIMQKIADDLIQKSFEPKKIIYFSFDEFKTAEIRAVLKEYEEISEADLTKGKYLLLLDEIQKLHDWESQIKSIYDAYKNIKIIISGSESLFIKNKSRETLAGRLYEFQIKPLTFKEYLQFKEIKLKPIGMYEKEYKKLFNEYCKTMGFPELINLGDKEIITKYIKESILEKVIYRDIPGLFKTKDTQTIASLLNIFMEEPGQLIDISELANDLKISRQTVSKYLSYLEDSFLIKKLYNYSKNRRKIERKLKKYYPTIISPELAFKEDQLSKSKVFEWAVVMGCNAEFFWRDPYKNEVDMVLQEIPAEIKYGKIEYKGIIAFIKKFRAKEGIIITYEKEETQKIEAANIRIIPAFKYFLTE